LYWLLTGFKPVLLPFGCAGVQGEPWPEWLVRVDRSKNIDIHLYVAGGADDDGQPLAGGK
jgi:hypothetical protein